MEFSDTARAIAQDLKAVLVNPETHDAPDVVAFSEAHKASRVRPAVKRVGTKRGWQVYVPPKGDVVLAVHPRHRLLETGYVHVLDAQTGLPKGNFSNRGVAFVTFITPAGNVVTDHSIHWITAFRLDRRPGPESPREIKHMEQTDAVIEQVTAHGEGRRVSFWQGDTNVPEDRDKGADNVAIHARFREHGLTSVWDELSASQAIPANFPSTHGRRGSTIDIIGSYDPDRRVTAVDARVRPIRHSDHQVVDAWYDVRPVRSKRVR
jgi:hypothetical protein